MDLIQKNFSAKTESLSDNRQVRVIVSTGDMDRDGEIIDPAGVTWKAFMATGAGPVLWNHNSNSPIAKCIELSKQGNGLVALVQFPPEGDDPESDRRYKQITFGSVPGASIGFMSVKSEPLDKANPVKGPQRYLQSEIMEFSFTPIPCNPNAIVLDKSSGNFKVGASKNLVLEEVSDWDAEAAAESIFGAADFDSDTPDSTFARKGFLCYDASAPDLRIAYKLPFAKMVDGKLVASADGLKAAASALTQSDLPDDIARKARAVIEYYEGKMSKPSRKSTVLKAGKKIEIKSIWQIGQLAGVLSDLDWLQQSVEYEAAYEEDGSAMPATLGAIMVELGNALIALTNEEVAELLERVEPEMEEPVEKGICAKTAPPIVKAIVGARLKSGRKFSAETISTLQEACKAIKSGHDMLNGMMEDGQATDTDDEAAGSDTEKAKTDARAKRLREVEVLRLKAPH